MEKQLKAKTMTVRFPCGHGKKYSFTYTPSTQTIILPCPKCGSYPKVS